MFENEFDIATLISLQQKGGLNPVQQEKLDNWIKAEPANRLLFEQLGNAEGVQDKLAKFSRIDDEAAWLKLSTALAGAKAPGRGMPLWPKLLAAAAAIAMIVFGLWFFEFGGPAGSQREDWVKNDIAPGRNGATLRLSTGELIQLSDAKKGLSIGKELRYDDGTEVGFSRSSREGLGSEAGQAGDDENSTSELTASTAKGQNYEFRLSDGTRVWLNAGSSLSFPRSFKGEKRRVSLTGEGYFEVAKDQQHPFVVLSGAQELEVLGTHFNINSYADERTVTTTLIEGRVRIGFKAEVQHGMRSKQVVLSPGEQGLLREGQLVKHSVDTEEALAWKNGYFRFNDEPIASVMRKLSRWYNIDVVYEAGISNENLNGRISRSNNISQVLNALQSTKTIHFKVEGRRVTVMQ